MRPPSYDSIPLKENDQQTRHPLETASFFSRVFYLWANPLMKLGNQRQLDFADLWPLQRENRCDVVSSEFSVKFRETNSILKAFLALYGWQTATIGVMQFFAMVCSLCGPMVLERVVSNIGVVDVWSLFGLVAALFGTNVLQAILQNQSDLLIEVLYVRLTAALQHLLYEKALVLNAKSRKGTGELTNLFTADMWQVLTLSFTANQVWIVPLQVISVMFLLWQVLGSAMLAGIGIIVLVLTLNRGMATTQKENWKVLMERRDARMKVINEVFNAIANVKMNAWEERYLDMIRELRDAELDSLRRHVWIFGGMSCMHHISLVVLISLSFAQYVFLLGQELTPTKVFTSLALFGMVKEPMMRLPQIIATWMLALVSYHRFADFLALEERDPNCVTSVVSCDDMSIEIRDGSFGWDAKKPFFQDLQLTIKRGEFVVVHGSVGEGKSTLCNILLGELDKYQGSVGVNGRIAYFAQQPWIQNLTVRDNILFGLPYDHAKYTKVIGACALEQDLMLFAAGDLTEIGSKGVNVSGGQKARISLARACYSDADIFILDSPLSAVDAIVQNELYTKCLLDLLRHKTILLVTHNPDIIASPYVDRTIEIKDGILIEKSNTDKKIFTPVASTDGVYAPSSSSAAKGALVVAEERVVGRVSKDIVKSYFEAFGGWPFIIALFSFQALGQVTQIASDLWLSYAISAETSYYLSVYSLIALAAALMNAGRTIMVLRAGIGAAKDLFDGMCRALFYAPLRFFDVTPIGRILNRFSGDMNQVDFPLPGALRYLTSLAFSFIFSLGTTVAVIRTFGLGLVPILWIYYSIASFYVMPAREIERLSKTSKSHMISHIAESIDGVAVIRAFGHVDRFKQVHHKNVDHRNETMFCNDLSGQWFALRIQLIGASMLFVITSSLVFSNLSPGMVGLVFNYSLQIMLQLQGLVQAWSSLETAMVAPERVAEYTNVEQEGMRVVPRSSDSSAWPQDGSITFQGVSYRYKPNDPLVLHDVCFEIQSGEKIGIVGRTGAGKSSLTMALFRINEIASGRIQIGGVSTATIGLKTLRESMAIIPQNPILFKGTLRSYLDPFDDYTDAELWNVVAKVQLTSRLSNEADKLLSVVQENGENFSVGERQMLCMARALLRQCRIVVMDEATAAIDHETDQTLQRVIRQEFATSTVVTIAHRLNTVLDSDRILVLDQGRLVQFDSPSALIQQGHGIFYELCQEGGYLDT